MHVKYWRSWLLIHEYFYNVVELVGGGSAINGGTLSSFCDDRDGKNLFQSWGEITVHSICENHETLNTSFSVRASS